MESNTAALEAFHWTPQPAAGRLVEKLVEDFLRCCGDARRLAERMRLETGTRFADWLDHLCIPTSDSLVVQLKEAGFVETSSCIESKRCFVQPWGMFPPILVTDGGPIRAAIKVESVVDFCARHTVATEIEGAAGGQFRRARIGVCGDAELWVVERHGYRGFAVPAFEPDRAVLAVRHGEAFRERERNFEDDVAGFAHAAMLVDAAVADIGADWTCDLFFAAERAYWESRNHAAQVQKRRQDRLGLGWANHDHHTYRSSRQSFNRLVGLLEKMGVRCRERFYAGSQAGWGAQVAEQAEAGIVIFADVDLSPDELFNDFAHEPLLERHELGTVGLWCALHGEAFLRAGMHHLECQFDFDMLREQLQREEKVGMMKPFTNFPYLRQAFTEGQRWPVCEERIPRLMAAGQITPQQAEQFRAEGAIGSHLENLERNDGFKGFNQEGVSEIIARTDPRRLQGKNIGA